MLLDKLSEKLSRKSALTDETQALLNNVKVSNKNKIVKKIATLMLAGAMALAPIGIAACTANCGVINNPTEQTQPNTPGGNTGTNPGGNNDDDKENIIDNLSDITKTVETDSYYRSLGERCRKNNRILDPDMKPIPFKFLRNHGHNVDAYLDGTLDVFASSYIYDDDKNHIYVSVKAENVSTHQYGNYYTNYVLKYPLTNQEYSDYVTLSKNGAIQAFYFIQELDNQKTPEIVNQINVQKETYNKMITEYTKNKNININNYNAFCIDLINFNNDEINISIRGASTSNNSRTLIGNLQITPSSFTQMHTYDNNVLYMGFAERVYFDHLDKYKDSLQNITSFSYGEKFTGTNPYPYELFDNVKNK